MTSPSTGAKIALLADRGVVRVAGEDAEKLLQGVITNDMELLAAQPAIHAALLTPQGKILFDFFVVKVAGWLFCSRPRRDKAAELAKRLAMYKLRAKAEIAGRSDDYRVLAAWGPCRDVEAAARGASFPDPRLPALGGALPCEAGDRHRLGTQAASRPRPRTTTHTASRWACPRAARTTRSATPSPTRPISISSTASPSPRAASSGRRW